MGGDATAFDQDEGDEQQNAAERVERRVDGRKDPHQLHERTLSVLADEIAHHAADMIDGVVVGRAVVVADHAALVGDDEFRAVQQRLIGSPSTAENSLT